MRIYVDRIEAKLAKFCGKLSVLVVDIFFQNFIHGRTIG